MLSIQTITFKSLHLSRLLISVFLTLTITVLIERGTANAQPYELLHTFMPPVNAVHPGEFGRYVALTGDHVVATGEDLGFGDDDQVFVFNARTGELKYTLEGSGDGGFGMQIAASDDLIAVSGVRSRNVYLYQLDSGELLETIPGSSVPGTPFTSRFGFDLEIENGSVLVGDHWQQLAHLFDASTGTLLKSFATPAPTVDDGQFGSEFAIQGNRIAIGATATDTVYFFNASDGSLVNTLVDPTEDGSLYSFARAGTAIDGDNVLIGEGHFKKDAHLYSFETGELLQTFTTEFPIDSVALEGHLALLGHFRGADLYDIGSGELIESFDTERPDSTRYVSSVVLDNGRVLINETITRGGRNIGQVHLYTAIPEPSSLLLSGLFFASVGLLIPRNSRGATHSKQIR